MKNRNFYNLFVVLVLSGIFILGCSPETNCPTPNQKVYLYYASDYVPYTGNDQIKFLHNNIDTQLFLVQGKVDYFINDNNAGDGGCNHDHQSQAVKFLNNTTNDIFMFKYEYDQTTFQYTSSSSSNPYTFYKLTYKNKNFFNKFYFSDTNRVNINNHLYNYVYYVGTDSNNCIFCGYGSGIISIRMNGEKWDLIP